MRPLSRLRHWLAARFIRWLTAERPLPPDGPRLEFDALASHVAPADVLLIDGRSRVSEIIKSISQSSWSHVAIYLGRPSGLEPAVRERLGAARAPGDDEALVLEVLLGQGTVVTPLTQYAGHHMRICRARGLAAEDRAAVLRYVVERIGYGYDLRQLFDLARFTLPWALFPRRWRSTLFLMNAGSHTRTVCSSLIAEAFQQVNFPVLPVVYGDRDGHIHWRKRNTRLYTPKDFDLSPFFDIIKYPPPGYEATPAYRSIRWEPVMSNGPDDCLDLDPSNGPDP
ncbi:MAG: YiiX/YebB-like N1pC/P60 family cysteine hydrolase [Acidiferrobacteraceae bacterium]